MKRKQQQSMKANKQSSIRRAWNKRIAWINDWWARVYFYKALFILGSYNKLLKIFDILLASEQETRGGRWYLSTHVSPLDKDHVRTRGEFTAALLLLLKECLEPYFIKHLYQESRTLRRYVIRNLLLNNTVGEPDSLRKHPRCY